MSESLVAAVSRFSSRSFRVFDMNNGEGPEDAGSLCFSTIVEMLVLGRSPKIVGEDDGALDCACQVARTMSADDLDEYLYRAYSDKPESEYPEVVRTLWPVASRQTDASVSLGW